MKKIKEIKKAKGFTLVELVIVVAIIGILISIAVPKFADATRSANNRKVEANARTLSEAIVIYYADYNVYPVEDQKDMILKIAGLDQEATKYSFNASSSGIEITYTAGTNGFEYSGNANNIVIDPNKTKKDGKAPNSYSVVTFKF